MVSVKSQNQIILEFIDLIRTAIPDADTKIGTVIRDLMIDPQSAQLSLLYDELSKLANLQSLRLVSGYDLDKLSLNYGAIRKTAVKSSGVALYTFSSIPSVVNINQNDLITASNGQTFLVSSGISVNPNSINAYRATATKYKNDLDFLGITDQYAVEVSVQASTAGSAGNISKYSLVRVATPGVSNITNTFSFTGGTDQETDDAFRNRVLAIFSGSNTGTALGYENTALSDPAVLDALVIGPGDPLMTRDGTVVVKDANGNLNIISEGTGGKVDIYILGNRLLEYKQSFIYKNLGNDNNPANIKNQVVLGQITGDENKTINKKRLDEFAAGTLPAQPVSEILEVVGSSSGSNFIEKTVDQFGRASGNYELIKDTSNVAGSPFGFDKFAWVSDRISGFSEDLIKGKSNGQDQPTFSGISQIPNITQNILISNENSPLYNNNRSIIQLLHTPATNITRVFNTNTGERYVITNANPDNTGSTNTSGRVYISGNTLPTSTDILQVDYTWIYNYDQYVDYDGKNVETNPRQSQDSIDWGFSNAIKSEVINFTRSNTFFTGTALHPVSSIISANFYLSATGTVSKVLSGIYAGRLQVSITNLQYDFSDRDAVKTIDSITLLNTNIEVYKTAQNDGSFTNTITVVGMTNRMNSNIILPTDTSASENDIVSVYYNFVDLFNISTNQGGINNNEITIPTANFSTVSYDYISGSVNNVKLKVNYIANVSEALSSNISNLPISHLGNGFYYSSDIFNNSTNISFKQNATVQQNGFSQFYIELSLSSLDYTLTEVDIISVIRLSDFNELWNSNNIGSITVNNTTSNYQVIFNGLNTPAIGDNILILCNPLDISRVQPFTYSNEIFYNSISQINFDGVNNNFYINLHSFTAESSLSFQVVDADSDGYYITASDGYITSPSGAYCTFGSLSVNFNDVKSLIGKELKISGAVQPNNNGTFNITDYNVSTNALTIQTYINAIDKNQVSVVKISDGKEYWNDSCTINLASNKLIIPNNLNLINGDKAYVYLYKYNILRQAPSRFSLLVNDQTNSSGTLTLSGDTIYKATDIIFSASDNSLEQDLSVALMTALGLSSGKSIPGSISIVRLSKLEKVEMATSTEVLSVLATYDVFKSSLLNNSLYPNEMNKDINLNNTTIILPSTSNNISNTPTLQDKLRATFYYVKKNDIENISFTRNGTAYTNKIFTKLNSLFVSSGFNSSQSTKLVLSYLNQPASGSRYSAVYDYLAPKQNERIYIRYNYNKLISDVSFNIEQTRPINADILVKEGTKLLVDITINIVVQSSFINSSTIVLQNVKDKLTSSINSNSFGGIIDASDLIAAAQGVDGVDRARVIYFNENNVAGQVLSLTAQNNQYFSANNVIVNIETR